ncbi:hypothetical protein ACEQ8H_006773 [Pleosporales sp. CAS-2024a]
MSDDEDIELVHARTIHSFLGSEKYSDLTITCGDDVHKVHKLVVCARSGFFQCAERFGKEAESGVIDLPEDEPAIIKLLLEFLYTSEYTPHLPPYKTAEELAKESIPQNLKTIFPHECNHRTRCRAVLCCHHTCNVECDDGGDCSVWVCDICCPPNPDSIIPSGGAAQLLLHSKLYTIARKYHVPGLAELAGDKFSRACGKHSNDDMFVTAIKHAFTTTLDSDVGMRKRVYRVLVDNPQLIVKGNIKEFLQAHPALMYDVLVFKKESVMKK